MTTPEWLDGQLIDGIDPAHVDCACPREPREPSCYTTARVTAGRARHRDHHVHRLQRDARAIGLGEVDASLVLQAFEELGRAVFADGSGIIVVEAFRMPDHATLSLHATTRPIGVEKDSWSAVTAAFAHRGPTTFPGTKLMHSSLYENARASAQRAAVDEALLFDEAGRLVEGGRTNLLLVDAVGRLVCPDPALGAVAGIALQIVSDSVPELSVAAICRSDLADARELIALNAVRGARPITQLDARAVAGGKPGLWVKRLDEILSQPFV